MFYIKFLISWVLPSSYMHFFNAFPSMISEKLYILPREGQNEIFKPSNLFEKFDAFKWLNLFQHILSFSRLSYGNKISIVIGNKKVT